MRSGGCPAGSSRGLRLDPYALPVRYAASDAAADGRVRDIELHRERVVVRRRVSGVPMALNMPLSAFTGIALHVVEREADAFVMVALMHKDPGLMLPLFVTREADEAMAEWRTWGSVLGLPLLVDDGNGLREPFARVGGVRVAKVKPRRRRRSALRKRRPSMLMRRVPGKLTAEAPVHRDEREIIARN
ncbi:hypothetical protein DW352_25065 [Pseudolabrys taiwanensis]|uniref:Uncharacterized protein n=1 Tax=Pseudolabrys taiwanensis TaxID=331696 RepID=A0A346A2W1_9HYPH|nr:DUF6101 family protein [Pseudolabrys taiwanensis]AXK83508.1 hypothetical protein DW352_25065 [Pseudolabrys taiwanensis]